MKTKLFSLLIVLAVCLVSCGKNSVNEEAQEEKFPETPGYIRLSFDESEPATEMVSIGRYMGEDTKSEHLEGLIDTNGKVICPFIYKMAWDSSEGYSIVGGNRRKRCS